MLSVEETTKTPARVDRIREEFRKLGGVKATRVFAMHLIASGFYDDEYLEEAQVRAVQVDVRKAITSRDKSDLPWAIQGIRDGQPVFIQRTLADYPAYEFAIEAGLKSIRADYRELYKLCEECRRLFGKAPVMPHLLDL